VSPQWAWPKASHNPACPGAWPNDGSRVRKTWPAAQPRALLLRDRPAGKQRTRRRTQPVELRRRRRRIARGELGAGREPQPLLHRSDAIADVASTTGREKARIAAREKNGGEVIAALGPQAAGAAQTRRAGRASTDRAPARQPARRPALPASQCATARHCGARERASPLSTSPLSAAQSAPHRLSLQRAGC